MIMPEPKLARVRQECGARHQSNLELSRASIRLARVPQMEGVSQVAGRILIAWKSGHSASLEHALEHARRFASRMDHSTTFEMERLEALTGAVESLEEVVDGMEDGRARSTGAVRLLEHLARAGRV